MRMLAANLATAAFLVAWQLSTQFSSPFLLPSPLAVGRALFVMVSQFTLAVHALVSLGHVAAATVIALVAGSVIAFIPFYFPRLDVLVSHRISPFLNSFVGIGWTLLGVLWFGVNGVTVVFAVTMALLPFAVVNIQIGLEQVSGELLELGYSLSRSAAKNLVLVILPMLLPYLFATLRIAFGVAWKVVLTAELLGGDSGLGYIMNIAMQELDTALILAGALLIVVVVQGAEYLILRPLQRYLDRGFRDG